ncbi:hypothetical protein LCGC14_1089920 [marine sediment metagenome]|uniref:Uncharacterized protein n=1 Tax=marine sediment metagenome TaxID=412755 RepID=A0A0F9QIN7_9ZZZZ
MPTPPLDDEKKERAAYLLATGSTQVEAANDIGVHKQTIYKLTLNPDFQRLVARFKQDLGREADEVLEGGVAAAAKTIVQMAEGKIDANSAQLKAALWLLDRVKGPKAPPRPDKEAQDEEKELAAELEGTHAEELEEMLSSGQPEQ